MKVHQTNFAEGNIYKKILELALPMTAAQIVHLLYNVVDRVYIGQIPGYGKMALTGLGLCFPIITIIAAFANLFGSGGAPLCSIERGKGNLDEAERVMGNSMTMVLLSGVVITVLGLLFYRPILFLFGASEDTFPYASDYIVIYLLGSIPSMITLGMNSFINSQGFGRIGMFTVLLGCGLNIVLDPLFIFTFGLGVRGAAIATVISQIGSAIWVVAFLRGRRAILRLRLDTMRVEWNRLKRIISLGLSNFVVAVTNSGVQVVCNATLRTYGGDLYVGVMTILNSIREILTMPVMGLTNGASPVMGFNYGAKAYERVKKSIKFVSIVCIVYTLAAWFILIQFPEVFIRIFNNEADLVQASIPAIQIYFFGFFMMALQFAGQNIFISLGKAKHAMFFSILRKGIIVIPLTLLLPTMYQLGVNGVFLAEPISNFIGGAACFITMLCVVLPELSGKKEKQADA